MAKKSANKSYGYFTFPEEDKKSASTGGAHDRGRLGVAGPPAARKSIATGQLMTRSQAAAVEAAEWANRGAPQNGMWAEQLEQGFGGGYGEYAAGVGAGYGGPGYDNVNAGGFNEYNNGYDRGLAGGGYNSAYGSGYNQGYAGGYNRGYGYDSGYNQGYGYDGGYGYNDGYNGGYNDGYGFDPAADPNYDPWAQVPMEETPQEQKKAKRGLLGKKKAGQDAPAPYVFTAADKRAMEAQARAASEGVINAYERGVPFGMGDNQYYDPYAYADDPALYAPYADDAASNQGGGKVRAAAGKAAAAIPTLAGLGVQVQIPSANMEKSLNLSASMSHQKRVDMGTGSRSASTMKVKRSKGSHGRGRQTYGADKELMRILRKRLVSILIILLGVALAAALGGVVGYFISLSNRLGLEDADAVKAVLTEPQEGEAYYVLFAADLNQFNGSNDDLDAMLLARIDEGNKKVTLLAIPGNIEVVLSDFDYHPATDARADGGNARLIVALSDLLDVKIAHYVQTDAEGLATIVDALGGIDMTLTQEIDDPQAGYLYMPAGDYTLDGEKALIVLRADNFHEGETARGQNRCVFGTLLMEKILSSGFLSFANVTNIIAGNVQTDYTAREILRLSKVMTGMTTEDVMSGVVPGDQETTQEGVKVFTPVYAELAEVMELVEAGVNPTVENNQGMNVNPANVSITVWNGSGVIGGAAMLGDILTAAGFDVQEVTNAAAYVYTETLVIYDDQSNLEPAYAVLNALGQGRVLDGTWKYTFSTDILVVLGSEWK